jgi:hypothetical protein
LLTLCNLCELCGSVVGKVLKKPVPQSNCVGSQAETG